MSEIHLSKIGIKLYADLSGHPALVKLIQGFERAEYEDAEESLPVEVTQYNAALDALESLILAHASEGIDVTSEAYQNGVQTAMDAIANNL